MNLIESNFQKVLVTGGSGYCGSVLIPQLLDQGYDVTVFDIMYFGSNFLPKVNSNLKIINGDIRNSQLINLLGGFKKRDIKFTIVDPKVNKEEVKKHTELTCLSSIPKNKKFSIIGKFIVK